MRADRQQPDIYFGRPGALISMPWPRGGLDAPFDRQTADFVTGSGAHRVSTLLGGNRLYSLNWNALHVDNYRKVEQYWTGSMGLGPWAIIDPSRPNLLTTQQASATSLWNDARDFSTSATNHGTVTSNQDPTQIHRTGANRSLRWQFTVAVAANPILTLSPPFRDWYGIPVQIGLSYAWSAWVKNVGDASMDVIAKIRWLNAAGGLISETVGTNPSITTWAQINAVGVAPALAAYAVPILYATGATITTTASFYVDEMVFEQDTVVNPWAPGTGVIPVEILSLSDAVPFASRFREKPTMVLRELAV